MAAAPAENPKTFISYAREDSEFALKLAGALRSAGVAVWIDQVDIRSGRWDVAVQAALEACPRVLVVLTPVSIKKNNVLDEVRYALDEGKEVIPVLYQECKVPFWMHRLHRVDVREGVAELLAFLGVGASVPAAAEPAAGTVRLNPAEGLEYVWIPAGEFWMGATPGDNDAAEDEKPPHRVRISKGFWLGKTPVTVAAYKRFAAAAKRRMPESPRFNEGWTFDDHPIVNVTWEDAKAYCEWAGGRLPTEAEWEYAARGGKEGLRYPWGNTISPEMANYAETYQGTTPVTRFPTQNDWGLHDMAGNVWERVADWYGSNYYASLRSNRPVQDPQGPLDGGWRALRGGSWSSGDSYLRGAERNSIEPDYRYNYTGFRVAREMFP